MKKPLFFSFGMLLALSSMAQTNSPNVVASGGGFFVAGTFTNSYTVGEMSMVETYTTGGFLLTQGFQQPYEFPLSVVPSEQSQELAAFPNPSNGMVSFQYNLNASSKVNVDVFDALGQIVYNSTDEKAAGSQRDQLNFTTFANGLYTVKYTITSNDGNSHFFVSRITLTK